jgi:hypothetical protein
VRVQAVCSKAFTSDVHLIAQWRRAVMIIAMPHVRFAPIADKQADVSLSPLCGQKPTHAPQQNHSHGLAYSITSSAVASSVVGMVRPLPPETAAALRHCGQSATLSTIFPGL